MIERSWSIPSGLRRSVPSAVSSVCSFSPSVPNDWKKVNLNGLFELVVNNFNSTTINWNWNGRHSNDRIRSKHIRRSVNERWTRVLFRLSDEIDELKNILVPDPGEEIYELREEITRYRTDLKLGVEEHEALIQDLTLKQNLLRKHEFDAQRQADIVTQLNDEVMNYLTLLHLTTDLDPSIARCIDQRTGHDHSSAIHWSLHRTFREMPKDDRYLENRNHSIERRTKNSSRSNSSDARSSESNEYRKESIDIESKTMEKCTRTTTAMDRSGATRSRSEHVRRYFSLLSSIDRSWKPSLELRSILFESNSFDDQDRHPTIDDQIEKSGQYLRDLQDEIERKTLRVKELDLCLTQERDRAKETETKLKVVLELRERDTHLHLRQLGETDAELRRARTDTERVRILQTQLELKQWEISWSHQRYVCWNYF